MLFRQPLVVHFVFVPSLLQPADPVSRLEAMCGGSRSFAIEAAQGIWERLGDDLSYARYIGCVVRYVGGGLGPVIPSLRENLERVDGSRRLVGGSWVMGDVVGVGALCAL